MVGLIWSADRVEGCRGWRLRFGREAVLEDFGSRRRISQQCVLCEGLAHCVLAQLKERLLFAWEDKGVTYTCSMREHGKEDN